MTVTPLDHMYYEKGKIIRKGISLCDQSYGRKVRMNIKELQK